VALSLNRREREYVVAEADSPTPKRTPNRLRRPSGPRDDRVSTGSLHTYGTARVAHLAAAAGFDGPGAQWSTTAGTPTRDAGISVRFVQRAGIPILSVHALLPAWGPWVGGG